MKTKIIPFDARMAKDIQDGKIKGRVRTKGGDFTARIICFDKIKLVHGDGTTEKQIVSLIYNENAREDILLVHNQKGEAQVTFGWEHGYDLVLEVTDDEQQKPQFKPFDKVLVRKDEDADGEPDTWVISFFMDDSVAGYRVLNGEWFDQCIPYEGNEHLVGTTDKPKEE